MLNKYEPDYLITPGEIIIEYLDYYNLTPTALAVLINIEPYIIDDIIKGKAVITLDIACEFEKVLGRSAHFWYNLGIQYAHDYIRLANDSYNSSIKMCTNYNDPVADIVMTLFFLGSLLYTIIGVFYHFYG